MKSNDSFTSWFIHDTNWSRVALPAAAVLLMLGPVVRRGLGKSVFSIFVQLPVYMIHQYEEHGHGAFKESGNRSWPKRLRRLNDGNIFVINIGGVWGVDLAALYVAYFRRPAAGLVAPYLAIVNGVIHLAGVLSARRYNPGSWTAGLLLLPAGIYSAVEVTRDTSASVRDHLRAFAEAVLVHVSVIALILNSPPTSQTEDSP